MVLVKHRRSPWAMGGSASPAAVPVPVAGVVASMLSIVPVPTFRVGTSASVAQLQAVTRRSLVAVKKVDTAVTFWAAVPTASLK